MADPPWETQRPAGWHTRKAKVALIYPTMTDAQIAELPVRSLSDRGCHLYLWTIQSRVEVSYRLARCWGFRPVTLLTWCKRPLGVGIGGTYAHTTEFVLLAKRGSLPALRRVETCWWEWPRGRHSEKPEAFFDLVEQVSPGPYLELFARRQRLGWDTWGDEALNHVELTG